MTLKKRLIKEQRVLLAIVIVVIVAAVSAINPRFIQVKNLITIFQQISVTGILTMAMSMLLIGGGIDLSIGNIMVLSGVVMASVIHSTGNTALAVAAGMAAGTLCGALNGVIIAKSKCIPLIITLGTSEMFYGMALTISGGRIMSFGGAFNAIGKTKLFQIFPVMLLVLAAMVVLSYILMNRTKFGRRIVAIGGNEKNAFLSGINIVRYKVILYGIAGLFCSVAAIIFSARIDSITANAGAGYETSALTAAIIGGVTFDGGKIAGLFCSVAAIIFSARIDSITANAGAGYETSALTAAIIGGVTFDGGKGTISGAFLGCVLMGVISNAMNILQVETYIQTIITGAIIVCAVVLSNINNIRRR